MSYQLEIDLSLPHKLQSLLYIRFRLGLKSHVLNVNFMK